MSIQQTDLAPSNGATKSNAKRRNTGFADLGVGTASQKVLRKLRFAEPTPVQREAIPAAVDGRDIIAVAQTGTGKTLAFGIPMVQRLARSKHGSGLVIAPTRELALQVQKSIEPILRAHDLRSVVLIGGEVMGKQLKQLKKNPRIVIATPGRLIDHLERRTIRLSDVRILVLDEADRMLDMGFAPQVNQILKSVPRKRQTLLFSATMPPEIVAIARQHMDEPVRVEIARSGTAAETVDQEMYFVDKGNKPRLLEVMLERSSGPVLVFTRTKHGARKLSRKVSNMGHASADIHSDRSLLQRRKALDGFKSGKYRVLVATDIAARGIDVSGIELVVNYDLPSNSEDYVHRIGRTGRAGLAGRAVSFATRDQRRDVKSIERLIRMDVPETAVPDLPPARRQTKPKAKQSDNKPSSNKASSRRKKAKRNHPGNPERTGWQYRGGKPSAKKKSPKRKREH